MNNEEDETKKIKEVKETDNHGIAGMIYGTEGVGKKTLASSAYKPVILSHFKRHISFPIYRAVNDYDDIMNMSLDSYETIIIDLTDESVFRMIENGPIRNDSNPHFPDPFTKSFENLILRIKKENKTVICICDEYKEGMSVYYRPQLLGMPNAFITKAVLDCFDFVGNLVKTVDDKRTLFLGPNSYCYTKISSGFKFPDKIEIPTIKDFRENTILSNMSQWNNKQNELNEISDVRKKEISDTKQFVDSLSDEQCLKIFHALEKGMLEKE